MRIVALTIAAASIISSPALAEGHSWQVGRDSFHVQFADLDLQSAAGRAQALARVERVAVRLCRDNNLQSDRAACEASVISGALRSPAGGTLQTALAERNAQSWAMAKPR